MDKADASSASRRRKKQDSTNLSHVDVNSFDDRESQKLKFRTRSQLFSGKGDFNVNQLLSDSNRLLREQLANAIGNIIFARVDPRDQSNYLLPENASGKSFKEDDSPEHDEYGKNDDEESIEYEERSSRHLSPSIESSKYLRKDGSGTSFEWENREAANRYSSGKRRLHKKQEEISKYSHGLERIPATKSSANLRPSSHKRHASAKSFRFMQPNHSISNTSDKTPNKNSNMRVELLYLFKAIEKLKTQLLKSAVNMIKLRSFGEPHRISNFNRFSHFEPPHTSRKNFIVSDLDLPQVIEQEGLEESRKTSLSVRPENLNIAELMSMTLESPRIPFMREGSQEMSIYGLPNNSMKLFRVMNLFSKNFNRTIRKAFNILRRRNDEYAALLRSNQLVARKLKNLVKSRKRSNNDSSVTSFDKLTDATSVKSHSVRFLFEKPQMTMYNDPLTVIRFAKRINSVLSMLNKVSKMTSFSIIKHRGFNLTTCADAYFYKLRVRFMHDIRLQASACRKLSESQQRSSKPITKSNRRTNQGFSKRTVISGLVRRYEMNRSVAYFKLLNYGVEQNLVENRKAQKTERMRTALSQWATRWQLMLQRSYQKLIDNFNRHAVKNRQVMLVDHKRRVLIGKLIRRQRVKMHHVLHNLTAINRKQDASSLRVDIRNLLKQTASKQLISKLRMKQLTAFLRLSNTSKHGSLGEAMKMVMESKKSSALERISLAQKLKAMTALSRMAVSTSTNKTMQKRFVIYRLLSAWKSKRSQAIGKLRICSGIQHMRHLKAEVTRSIFNKLFRRTEGKLRRAIHKLTGKEEGSRLQSPEKSSAIKVSSVLRKLVSACEEKTKETLNTIRDLNQPTIASKPKSTRNILIAVSEAPSSRSRRNEDMFDKLKAVKRDSLETLSRLTESSRKETASKTRRDERSEQKRVLLNLILRHVSRLSTAVFKRLQLNSNETNLMSSEAYYKLKGIFFRLQVAQEFKLNTCFTHLRSWGLYTSDLSQLTFLSSQVLTNSMSRMVKSSKDKSAWAMARLTQNMMLSRAQESQKRSSFKLQRTEGVTVAGEKRQQQRELATTASVERLPLVRVNEVRVLDTLSVKGESKHIEFADLGYVRVDVVKKPIEFCLTANMTRASSLPMLEIGSTELFSIDGYTPTLVESTINETIVKGEQKIVEAESINSMLVIEPVPKRLSVQVLKPHVVEETPTPVQEVLLNPLIVVAAPKILEQVQLRVREVPVKPRPKFKVVESLHSFNIEPLIKKLELSTLQVIKFEPQSRPLIQFTLQNFSLEPIVKDLTQVLSESMQVGPTFKLPILLHSPLQSVFFESTAKRILEFTSLDTINLARIDKQRPSVEVTASIEIPSHVKPSPILELCQLQHLAFEGRLSPNTMASTVSLQADEDVKSNSPGSKQCSIIVRLIARLRIETLRKTFDRISNISWQAALRTQTTLNRIHCERIEELRCERDELKQTLQLCNTAAVRRIVSVTRHTQTMLEARVDVASNTDSMPISVRAQDAVTAKPIESQQVEASEKKKVKQFEIDEVNNAPIENGLLVPHAEHYKHDDEMSSVFAYECDTMPTVPHAYIEQVGRRVVDYELKVCNRIATLRILSRLVRTCNRLVLRANFKLL